MRRFPEPVAVWVNDHVVSLGVHTGAKVRHSSLSVCTGFKLVSSLQTVLCTISSLYEHGGGLDAQPSNEYELWCHLPSLVHHMGKGSVNSVILCNSCSRRGPDFLCESLEMGSCIFTVIYFSPFSNIAIFQILKSCIFNFYGYSPEFDKINQIKPMQWYFPYFTCCLNQELQEMWSALCP